MMTVVFLAGVKANLSLSTLTLNGSSRLEQEGREHFSSPNRQEAPKLPLALHSPGMKSHFSPHKFLVSHLVFAHSRWRPWEGEKIWRRV